MQLPIGVSDFRKLIETRDSQGNPYLFIDKSLFIKDVIDDLAEVKLFTRPRRFGKTLNMSMLHHFLAKEVDGKSTRELFDSLKIETHKQYLERHQGKYPVVYITFKDIIKENSFEAAYQRFCKEISKVYVNFQYLLASPKLSSYQKKVFGSVLEERASAVSIQTALSDLTQSLFLHHDVKPWVLIDEYDAPIQTAYLGGYYREAMDFMRGFFGAGLKDNRYLEKAVMTGILRVAKESIFSGLNNISVYSLLYSEYGVHFGFTEMEVKALLEKSNLSENLNEVKTWYNGYQAGETILYNPWSIVNYIKKQGKLDTYWINASDNALVKKLIIKADIDFKSQLDLLLQGQPLEKSINDNIVFEELDNSIPALWTLLIMSGYLKVKPVVKAGQSPLYQIEIPNIEVRELYQKTIFEWLLDSDDTAFRTFIEDLLKGDMDKFETQLQRILMQTMSIHDIKGKTPEKFFHGFMLGLVAGIDPKKYRILSNQESGHGRFDIALIPNDLTKLGVLIEVKSVEEHKTKNLRDFAKEALEQIEEQHYDAVLSQHQVKGFLKIGAAFSGKELAVEYTLRE